MPSAELSLLRSPRHAYAQLVDRPVRVSWLGAMRRPLIAAVLLGAMMATTATGIVDPIVVVRTTAAWAFVIVVQMVAAAVLIATGRRDVPGPRGFDLLFAANAPWSLWLIGFTAYVTVTSPIGRAPHFVLPATLLPAAWTAWLVYAFCREVLGDERRAAIRKTAIHQASMWAIALLYFAWAVQVWPRAIGVWIELRTGTVQPAIAELSSAPAAAPLPTSDNDRRGPWIVIAADFHVHTAPGDGALLPSDWAREAHRRGLGAIAITGHNQMVAVRSLAPDAKPFGVLVIRGEEITTPFYHLAAVGLDHPVDWNQPLDAIVAAVHAQHGAVIAAHPAGAHRPPWTDNALRLVDGVEVAHPTMFAQASDAADLRDAWEHAHRAHPTIAPIGSSDEHTAQPIGLCRTFLFVDDVSSAGVVDAIRHGRTVACDAAGGVTGDPALTRQVEPACRAAAEPIVPTASQRTVTAVAWMALVALALFALP